jgi:outer membrane protein OmpA-like peptidoglycan-associated protein
MRTIPIVAVAALIGLAGCQTMQGMRSRFVRAPQQCQDEVVPIYFATGRAELTPDGRKVLFDAATRARACTIKAINVVGLADAGGDEAANFELSKRRAAQVSEAMVDAGLPPRELQLAAAGEGGAVTPDGKVDPLRRRAEITFVLEPPPAR